MSKRPEVTKELSLALERYINPKTTQEFIWLKKSRLIMPQDTQSEWIT